MLNKLKKFFADYDAYLRKPPKPAHHGDGPEAAFDALAKFLAVGMDLGPAVNKVAYEYGANARALYTFAALGPVVEGGM